MATAFLMDDQIQFDLETESERILPATLSLRAAQWADLESVAQLILDVCTKDGDPSVATSPEDLRNEWETPGFDIETDAWVVTTSDGRVVGYEELYNRYAHASLRGDGYVHPDFEGRGIGTALLRVMEARARQQIDLAEPEQRVFVRNAMENRDMRAREMHANEGYNPVRYTWRMETTLEEAPPAPAWPEGVELRPFDLEQHDYLVYRAHEEAFRDHWGSVLHPYEHWQHHMVERFVQVGDELLAVLSNGELWSTSLDAITWERILPQVPDVHAAAGY